MYPPPRPTPATFKDSRDIQLKQLAYNGCVHPLHEVGYVLAPCTTVVAVSLERYEEEVIEWDYSLVIKASSPTHS